MVATPGARELRANEQAVVYGPRIFPSYGVSPLSTLGIITQADRPVTTLLPEEY